MYLNRIAKGSILRKCIREIHFADSYYRFDQYLNYFHFTVFQTVLRTIMRVNLNAQWGRNVERDVYLGAIFVRFFSMSVKNGLIYFEQHFLFSNKFFQYTMGFRPCQCSNDLLFQVCTIIAYVFPGIAHQVNVFFFNEYTIISIRIIIIVIVILSVIFFP